MCNRLTLIFFHFLLIIIFNASVSAQLLPSTTGSPGQAGERNETFEGDINSTEGNSLWTVSEMDDSTDEVPITDSISSQTNVEEVKNSQPPEISIEESKVELKNSTEVKEEEDEKVDREDSSDAEEGIDDSEMSFYTTTITSTIKRTPSPSYSKMDEKISLARNNCDLEIPVEDDRDTRIQIEFEPPKKDSQGKCGISLMGKNTFLAIQITEILLQEENEETLKVILTDGGIDFLLKEYNSGIGKEENHPLLLTQTDRAFIVLYYNVTTTAAPSPDFTRFNLEVFGYGKNENNIVENVHDKYENYNKYETYDKHDTYNKYDMYDKHNKYNKYEMYGGHDDKYDKISSYSRLTFRKGDDVERIFLTTEEPKFFKRDLSKN